MMWPWEWFRKRREEKLRRQREIERRRKELETELLKLYEEDKDFQEFLKFMELSEKANDAFSAMIFQMIAAAHLEEVIKKHGWEQKKFSKFLDEAEQTREMVIRLALNLTKKTR